jgi:hypothetical protein
MNREINYQLINSRGVTKYDSLSMMVKSQKYTKRSCISICAIYCMKRYYITKMAIINDHSCISSKKY